MNRKYERLSAVFVGGALFACVGFLLLVSTQRGWFQSKIVFETVLESGDGIRVGTPVEMVGIRVGSVTEMELDERNRIRTQIRILRKFASRVRTDSRLLLARPFVVGDKVLHLTPGDPSAAEIPEGGTIPSQDSLGVMDLIGGQKFTPYLATLESAASEMKKLVDRLLKEKGSDKMATALLSLPDMMKEVARAASELAVVSKQMSEGRMVAALDEVVVVLKAMEKSFLLRSAAREVREEEAKAREESRKPASKN